MLILNTIYETITWKPLNLINSKHVKLLQNLLECGIELKQVSNMSEGSTYNQRDSLEI